MQYKNELAEFLPAGAIDFVFPFLAQNKVHMKITRRRTTKHGDYRPPIQYPNHRISVNGSLNPYLFLITLVHEMAHLEMWKKHKSRHEPHGNQWKTTFVAMMMPLIENGIFPSDLKQVLLSHLQNPTATSSDKNLTMALQRYDKKKAIVLQDIPADSLFVLNRRVFKKLEKLRSNYSCQCYYTKKMYRVSGLAEVTPIQESDMKSARADL